MQSELFFGVMTVCIAVTPRFRDEIILVSDRLLSCDVTSVEGGFKLTKLAPGIEWYIMFAGDAPRFKPLIERMREPLGGVQETRLSLDSAVALAERAYYVELTNFIEAEVLAPYGMSRDDFIKKGRRWLGNSSYTQILNVIGSTDLGIEILVVGLDADAETQMFSVSAHGVATRALLPYHAIGSGSYLALGTLYQLAGFPGMDVTENIYRACAAKFAAEAAPGVGRETHAMVVNPLSNTSAVIFGFNQLREIWQAQGQPPFPAAARRLIQRDLKPMRLQLPRRFKKHRRPAG